MDSLSSTICRASAKRGEKRRRMVALVLFEWRKESYRLCFVWRVFLCEVRCRGTVCFEVVGAGVWAWTACESGSCFDLYSRNFCTFSKNSLLFLSHLISFISSDSDSGPRSEARTNNNISLSILPHSLSLDQHRHVSEQAALLDRALPPLLRTRARRAHTPPRLGHRR